MKIKPYLSFLLVAFLIGSLLGPHATAAASKKKSRAQVVGTDPVGDWGSNVLPDSFPLVGDLLGQDLVEAAIEMAADRKTVNFIITLNSLPGIGGTPEVSRYMWEFAVEGRSFLLDGRFTNYHRGICDPESETCPPPRDPGMAPFSVRKACGPGYTPVAVACPEIGLVHATFDQSAATISIPVPLKLIDAGPGSRISPAYVHFAQQFGGNVIAAPSAWYWSGDVPGDALQVTRTFVVR